MAITINWGTKIIYVPRADLTLVQSSPTEIRELDLNWFRLQLKDLEDSSEGIWALDTHRHNTEVSLGGLTYARVIEIINGYTITFEDGQYAVNLIGANSNVADNVNVNQVSVRSANSAGLISNSAIEYASFNGGVTIDVINGEAGTVYNTGTPQSPVNNLSDAILIAQYRGFDKLLVVGDLTVSSGINVENFAIEGQSMVKSHIYLDDGALTNGLEVTNATVSGILDGDSYIENCIIKDLIYVNGYVRNCGLKGIITLAGNKDSVFPNCYTPDQDDPVIIDMGGSGNSLSIPNYSGILTIRNLSDADQEIGVGMNAGLVYLEDTITAGTIIVSGSGLLVDYSTGAALVNTDGLMSKDTISQAVLNTPLLGFEGTNTVAESLKLTAFANHVTIDTSTSYSGTAYPAGTMSRPVNNLEDAVAIADHYGFTKIHFLSDYDFKEGVNISEYEFYGQGKQETILSFETGSITAYCSVFNAQVTGLSFGVTYLEDCHLYNYGGSGLLPSDKTIITKASMISGYTVIPSNFSGELQVLDCWGGGTTFSGIHVMDVGGAPCSISIRNFYGATAIRNCTNSGATLSYEIGTGYITLEDTCTAGRIELAGIGNVLDNSNGSIVEYSGMLSKSTVADATLNTSLIPYNTDNTVAESLKLAAYNGVITVSEGTSYSGTSYPAGTRGKPLNNINDACAASHQVGFDDIRIIGNYTFTSSTNIDEHVIIGDGLQVSLFTFDPGCTLSGCIIKSAKVTGNDLGIVGFYDCYLSNMSPYVNSPDKEIILQDCILEGQSTLVSSWQPDSHLEFLNCYARSSAAETPFTLDINNCSAIISFRGFSGTMSIENNNNPDLVLDIFMESGVIIIDSSVTAGLIRISGVGILLDYSSGATISSDGLMAKNTISQAVLNTSLIEFNASNTVAESLKRSAYGNMVSIDVNSTVSGTVYPAGTLDSPVNNLADAVIIATALGYDVLNFNSNFTFEAGTFLSNYHFVGQSHSTVLTFEDGSVQAYCSCENATMTGRSYGLTSMNNVTHDDYGASASLPPSDKTIVLTNSLIKGETYIPSTYTGTIYVIDCWSAGNTEGSAPIMNTNGAACNIIVRNFNGATKVVNSNDAAARYSYDFNSGSIIIDSTCVSGSMDVRGVGKLTDNSGPNFIVDSSGLMSTSTIANSVELAVGDEIQFAAYDNRVSIDTVSGVAGTAYPIGTPFYPVNNLTDAKSIAESRGFDVLYLLSTLTVASGESVADYIIKSSNYYELTLEDGCVTDETIFHRLSLNGYFSGGWNIIEDCWTYNAYNFAGWFRGGSIEHIELAPWNDYSMGYTYFDNLVPMYTDIAGVVVGNTSISGSFTNCMSKIELHNLTAGSIINAGLSGGEITVDSSCVGGNIEVTGVGTLINNSNLTIDDSGLMEQDTVAKAVWDEPIALHQEHETTGHLLYHQFYENMVTIDTVSGTAGTGFPVGSHETPVNNLSDALTIAAAHNFTNIHIQGSLTINGEDITGYTFTADRSLGNSITITSMVNTDACYFTDLTVAGNLSGDVRFTTCVLGALNNYSGGAKDCLITGNIVVTGTGANYFTNCDTYMVDDTFKEISVGTSNLNIIRGRGAIEIADLTGTQLLACDLVGGHFKVASSCTSGVVAIGGNVRLVDESGPGCIVISAVLNSSVISNIVWDEILTGDTHNLPSSAGRRLRQLSSAVIIEGEVVSATSNTVSFDGDASNVDGAYDPAVITINDGPGVGQSRLILEYIGSTKTAIVDRDWKTLPTSESKFIITADGGREHVNEGLVQAATTNTVTLNAYASPYDNAYVNQQIFIRSGTGEDQVKRVESYNGTTKVATIDGTWYELPDATSAYVMMPMKYISSSDIADAIWDEPTSEHTTEGTTGYALTTVSGINVDIDLSGIESTLAGMEVSIDRALGLLQENQYLDQAVYTNYNGQKLLTGGRIRTYSDAVSVGTTSNVLATYQITATWSGDEMTSYKVVKV